MRYLIAFCLALTIGQTSSAQGLDAESLNLLLGNLGNSNGAVTLPARPDITNEDLKAFLLERLAGNMDELRLRLEMLASRLRELDDEIEDPGNGIGNGGGAIIQPIDPETALRRWIIGELSDRIRDGLSEARVKREMIDRQVLENSLKLAVLEQALEQRRDARSGTALRLWLRSDPSCLGRLVGQRPSIQPIGDFRY